MKHFNTLGWASAVALLAMVSNVSATNITIWDQQGGGGIGKGGEDQETEPGTINSQAWDFEAFDLQIGVGKTLSLYGGFNLLSGETPYGSGDIFIDVDGDATWQPGADNGAGISSPTDNSKFKFDYVIHFTGRSGITIPGTYEVYSLAEDSSVKLLRTEFKGQSNPWIYVSGGTLVASAQSSINQVDLGSGDVVLSDGSVLKGGKHYVSSFDLDFISGNTVPVGSIFKTTQQCGNDSLVGRVADTGSAMALLGAAMTGLSMFVRRSRKS